MIHTILRKIMTAMAAAGLVSCGGAGSGLFAGGGISGTGLGTITAFGSVEINDIRDFTTDANTQFFLDDDPVADQATLEALLCGGVPCVATNPGMVARVDIGSDVSADFTSGTAITVNAFNLVKGPVTGINPLQALEQTLLVTGDTVLVNVPGNDHANLQLSDVVEVSGFDNGNNAIQVTRLEFKGANNTGTLVWKLAGKVTATAAGEFNIGTQRVVLNGVVARDCAGPVPAVGELVEVKAAEDPGFAAGGDTLDTATDVECQVPGLGVPPGTAGTVLEAEVEGLVNAPACAGGDFEVGGQCVALLPTTLFEDGDVGDIVIGTKLEAEGDLNTTNGVLTADKIRFRENRVRIEGPVNVPAGGVGGSFTILGNAIAVNTTSLTEDNDDLINNPANSGNRQIEVRGYVDSNGNVFATELRDRGPGDAGDVRLRGPTTDTCDGNVDTELTILGVTVDTDSIPANPPALYFNETVEPAVPLADDDALCALISVGSNVEAEGGVFTSAPPRIDDAELYSIEDL